MTPPMPEPRLLITWLSRLAPGAVVLTDGMREWRAGELLGEVEAGRNDFGCFQGRTVALAVTSAPDLARLLLLLDGVAAAVLLVPPGWTAATREQYFIRAGVDRFIAEDPPTGGTGPEWWSSEEVLSVGHPAEGGPASGGQDTRVVIPTSGTTGEPKLVSHSWATLCRAVKAGPDSCCRRWGLLYELNRFAGLQVFLQALASGATLLITDQLGDLESRLALLVSRRCDALSATPTLWRKILMSPSGRRLPLRQVTLGGEIADRTVLAALAAAFPQARVTHIYASTEAGVGFSVKDGKAGFPSRYLQEPPGGVELRLDAEGRLWLRPSVRGQFFVGRTCFDMETAEGWIDSGDLVKQEGERCHFLGRANGAINVGGDKVYPEEVEQVILELPEVALARVTGRRNPIVGALVQAVVVPREGEADPAALGRLVREHCAARLARFKVPAVVTVASSLDMAEAGKLARPSAPESGGIEP